MKRFTLDRVTGITVLILIIIGFTVFRVLTGEGFTADQKTMVIQGALIALGGIGGYWLNSTADANKPHPPGTTTTTTTTPPTDSTKVAEVKTSTEVKP